MRDFLKIVELQSFTSLHDFQRFCFSLVGAVNHEEFSENVRKLQAKDERFAANLQDEILAAPEFSEITGDPAMRLLAAELMDIEPDDIEIVMPFFRVDLPQQFADQEKKMSLPWHQEFGYYSTEHGCTPDSIVMSIALHDCSSEEGALHIARDTQSEVIQHQSVYMNQAEKRHLRVRCPEPAEYAIAETQFGQVVAFDFKRPHRSGVNNSHLVRLTLLLRATSNIELARFKETSNMKGSDEKWRM